ncbi:SIR2 family protein [Aeromonas sp. R2-3]|uniref:SIR2 family protein n=1 Tax=Aeromonas sp. R2-3 TaxID=3138461 RepID=UPI0034A3E764
MHSDFIKNIYRAKEEHRLSIFVGAGVSKTADSNGKRFPDWAELINEFRETLGTDDENDYLKLAQLYYLKFGEFTYYEKLKSYFDIVMEPSIVHRLIIQAKPQHIITTNWDNLLEKEVYNSIGLYDKVVSDEDLTKSLLPNKLIKMHGDFEHHNIVFKEDDYLNYEYNFPLIANYIKGVLSTNSILFLGYSYNDSDLKRIVMWLKNNTKARPPMYLVTFSKNQYQMKYLENHGLTTIVLDDNFLGPTSSYSDRLASFLERIVNYRDDRESKKQTPTDYILNKLNGLGELNHILQSHVLKCLGNCGFIYGPNLVLLQFYDKTATHDYNEDSRKIYLEFTSQLATLDKNVISDKEKFKISEIFNILSRAGISGISLSEGNGGTNVGYIQTSYFSPSKTHSEINEIFNFEYPSPPSIHDPINNHLNKAILFLQYGDYRECLQVTDSALRLAVWQKKYPQLLIFAKNYKNIQLYMPKSLSDDSKKDSIPTTKSVISSLFKDVSEYFSSFPYKIQKELYFFYEALDDNYCKAESYKAFIALDKELKAQEIRERGGFSFSNTEFKAQCTHKNILYFFLGNGIAANLTPGFCDLNKSYVKASFSRQTRSEIIRLEHHEIYSLIAFFSTSELRELLSKYFKKDNNITLSISNEHIDTLLSKTLCNLLDASRKNKKPSFQSYLFNLIYLFSYIKLTPAQIDLILKSIKEIINSSSYGIEIYDALNTFLGLQHNLFSAQFNEGEITSIIELIVLKFSRGSATGYDRLALEYHTPRNLYVVAEKHNFLFKDTSKIHRLIAELKITSLDNQYNLSKGLLILLYNIGDENVKGILTSYFNELNFAVLNNPTFEGVKLHLFLIVNDIIQPQDCDISVLEHFMENGGREIEPYRFIGEFESLINFLSINKGLKQYGELLSKLNPQHQSMLNDVTNDINQQGLTEKGNSFSKAEAEITKEDDTSPREKAESPKEDDSSGSK